MKQTWVIFLMACGLAQAGSYEDFFNAVKQDNPAQVKALLARGFDANTVNPNSQTGLQLALKEDAPKVAHALAEWPGTDPNKLNPQGESALMLAALKGHTALATKLISKGADINKTGWTPLHYAASSAQIELISLLLEHSAYIDAASPNGTTPLMMAAMYGSLASVKLLLQEGADVKLKNQQGLTALEFAQRGNRSDAVKAIAEFIRNQRQAGQW